MRILAAVFALSLVVACGSPPPQGDSVRVVKETKAVSLTPVAKMVLPDPTLTPGATLTAKADAVCVRGYAKKVRHVPLSEKKQVYVRYGNIRSKSPKGSHATARCCEVDHLVSLELGGSNDITNLWPQPYPEAYSKDSVENWAHVQVCSRVLLLADVQKSIASDWTVLYHKMKGDAQFIHPKLVRPD